MRDETTGIEKILHRGISRFSVETFCFTVPKNFVGAPLCVPKNFWYQKFLFIRASGSCGNFLVSHEQKTSYLGPFCVAEIFSSGKELMDKKMAGISGFSVEMFCSQSAEETVAEPFNVSEIFLCGKNFMEKIWG